MGMTIDETISDLTELKICGVVPFTKGTISGGNYKVITGDCLDEAIDTMRKYQMMQADYETRLKADIVAMLTEILLEAEENTVRWYVGRVDGKSDDVVLMETLQEIIQQKIDKLKEVEE